MKLVGVNEGAPAKEQEGVVRLTKNDAIEPTIEIAVIYDGVWKLKTAYEWVLSNVAHESGFRY